MTMMSGHRTALHNCITFILSWLLLPANMLLRLLTASLPEGTTTVIQHFFPVFHAVLLGHHACFPVLHPASTFLHLSATFLPSGTAAAIQHLLSVFHASLL